MVDIIKNVIFITNNNYRVQYRAVGDCLSLIVAIR